MKVLFVSNTKPAFHNTNYYRLRAISSLGHHSVVVDVRAYFFHPRIRQKFPIVEALEMARINAELVRRAEVERPLICLVVGGVEVSAEALRRIRALGISCVLWTSDAPHPHYFKNIIQTAGLYNRVYCAGTEAVEILAKNGFGQAKWLTFAADSNLHCPVVLTPDEVRGYHRAVSFVGAYYPNRGDVLAVLKEFNPGIWGPHWKASGRSSSLASFIVDGHVDYKEWVKIYTAADIVLVLHYQDGKVPCYQASPKLFEALACGAFVLCDNQPDACALFKDGEHCVFFKNPIDLKDKIRYYLDRPLERRRIAAQGRQEVLARHTYDHRLGEILKGA